jgi:DNA-binding GntR family transcriptional regulator
VSFQDSLSRNGTERLGVMPAFRERSDRIYQTIRDRICMLDYPPGARISEEELSEEFSTSRTPIRRVLARLDAEGLVDVRNGVGTFVTDASIEQLSQIFSLRMELTVLFGRLSPASPSPEALDRIRALIDGIDELSRESKPEPRTFARLNMSFFFEISALIGNQPLREISERLYLQTFRIWLQINPLINLADEIAVFRREMIDVLRALEVNDLDAVGYIRRAYLSMSSAHELKHRTRTETI